MKKKYFILALTFLCMIVGYSGYGQGSGGDIYPPMFDGEGVSQINEFTLEGTNYLYDVIIENDYHSSGGISLIDAIEIYLWEHPDYNTPPDPENIPDTDICELYPDLCNYINNDPCNMTCPNGYTLNPENCGCIQIDPCISIRLASHVYNTSNGYQEVGKGELNDNNIHLVSPAGLPSEFNGFKWTDPDSGFSSALYRVDHGDGNIEFVYATEGTTPLSYNDWKNNIQQNLGFESEQYNLSVKNAGILAKWASDNGYTLTFTGHSLGGSLANANALATGLPATVYNPAGLDDNTVSNAELGLNLENSKNVTAYVVRGEPVNALNEFTNTPVRGTTLYIGNNITDTAAILSNAAIPLSQIISLPLHLMGTIVSLSDCN